MKKVKPTKNPMYAGNTVWGTTPKWLIQEKAYLDKNQGKPINQFAVFKEANGDWRWVTLSSSAFRDQDKEIVSTKALYNDVLRADEDRDYGPLRWWHVKTANIGSCDFNMLYGHVLIESGTFVNERVAQAIKGVSDKLGVSIGFYHPVNEPDNEGVFHNIKRFERSLLPKEIASNPLTALVVKQKELKNMVDEKQKIEALRGIVGDDLAREILSNAQHSEKAAIGQNIEFKQSDKMGTDEEEVVPSEEMEEEEEELEEELSEDEEKCGGLNKPKKEKETVILKRPKKVEGEGAPQPAPAEQPAQQAPPPKPADYQRAESEPVAQRPAKAAIQAEEKAPDQPSAEAEEQKPVEKPAPAQEPVEKPAPAPAEQPQAQAEEGGEYEEVEMEEVPLPEVIGNMTIEEFGELLASVLSEALAPYLQTVKEAKAGLEKARLDFEVSTKEKDARESEVSALKEKVSVLSNALENAAEKIAGLEGDIPAVARGYVASESNDTVLGTGDETLKNARPHEGNSFVDWLAQPQKS